MKTINRQQEITSLTCAEIMTWYKNNSDMPEATRRSTPYISLLSAMTPGQRRDAQFTPEQKQAFLNGEL